MSTFAGELHDQPEVAGQLVGGAESLEDGVVLQPTLARKERRLSSIAGPAKDARKLVFCSSGLPLP